MPDSSFSDVNLGEELRLGDQSLRYDRDLTRKAYTGIATGGSEECGCSYCRNLIVQRDSIYPPSFLQLLDRLGIDPKKEGETYECGPAKEERRNYGGWFFFCGQLLERGERHVSEAGMEYWVSNGRSLPRSSGEFGLDILALNFTTTIPWVLPEEA